MAKKKTKKASRKKSHRKAKKKSGKRKSHRKAKAKKTHRKSSKRSRAAKKAARTRAEKKAKRSAAAKKAARSRKRKKSHGKKRKARKSSKRKARRGKKRKARAGKKKSRKSSKRKSRKSPKKRRRSAGTRRYERELARKVAKGQRRKAKKERTKKRKVAKKTREIDKQERRIARLRAEKARLEAAAERRRHHRRGHKKHHHAARAPNPIGSSGWTEFLAGFLGAVAGGGLSLITDRYAATHALGTDTANNNAYQDAPGVGQVYNSQGPNTPIWSSWSRIAWAAASILTPLGISAVIDEKDHPHAKSFFQIMFFGALTVTGTKAVADGASSLAGSTALGARLFAPEAAATAQLGAQGASGGQQLQSVDLSQVTNAAGTQIKQQAGQGSVFVAGAPRSMAPAPSQTRPQLNPYPLIPRGGSSTPMPTSTPAPTSSTPAPSSTCPPMPAPQGSPSPIPSNNNPLPGNTTGPVCLACTQPRHAGACSDGFNPFDPAGEAAVDPAAEGTGDLH